MKAEYCYQTTIFVGFLWFILRSEISKSTFYWIASFRFFNSLFCLISCYIWSKNTLVFFVILHSSVWFNVWTLIYVDVVTICFRWYFLLIIRFETKSASLDAEFELQFRILRNWMNLNDSNDVDPRSGK